VHLELVRERPGLQELRALGPALQERRRPAEEREIDLDLLLDLGSADLDDHAPAVPHQGAVDLSDRGGGQRRLVDLDERIRRQVLRDDAPDVRERNAGHLVDQLPQLVDVDVRKKVRARREQLAELDERRAELLECMAELDRSLPRRGPAPHDAELAQNAQEPALARDARHGRRPSGSLEALRHQPLLSWEARPKPRVLRN